MTPLGEARWEEAYWATGQISTTRWSAPDAPLLRRAGKRPLEQRCCWLGVARLRWPHPLPALLLHCGSDLQLRSRRPVHLQGIRLMHVPLPEYATRWERSAQVPTTAWSKRSSPAQTRDPAHLRLAEHPPGPARGVPVADLLQHPKKALSPRPPQPSRVRTEIIYAGSRRIATGVHDQG